MNGPAARNRFLPYLLAFFGSLCIMILELVASRLVARHVGASLNVWTSVIGIMLGGICLGNVLGGRLADRSDPSRVIGPLYGLGAALSLSCLWLNALGAYIPEEGVPNWFRTVTLVSIDFLVPGTVLGMIGPVVAKLAVEQARKTGSAIGDVYFLGAVGSIAGTFLAGFLLMRYAPTTTIVTLVAAGLALMAAFLIGDKIGLILGLVTTALLGLGSIAPLTQLLPIKGVNVGGITINPIALAGHVTALALAVVGLVRLIQAKLPEELPAEDLVIGRAAPEAEADRPGGALVPDQPGVHGLRDGGRSAGLSPPGVEHLRLDQRHRRAPGRPEPGELLRRQDRRLRQEREAGELAVPLRLGLAALGALAGDAAPVADQQPDRLPVPGTASRGADQGVELGPQRRDHDVGVVLGRAGLLRHRPGVLPAFGGAGDGEPGDGQARDRPGPADQADRLGDRRGLRLGDGR